MPPTGLAYALRSALMARVAANKFLNENLPEHAELTGSHLKDFDAKVGLMKAELEDPAHQKMSADAIAAIAGYATAFEGAYQAILARNDVVANELNKIGPNIEAALDQLMSDNKAEQDTLGPKASAEMQTSLTVAIAISVTAIILGILLGYFIARSITRPIQGMTTCHGRAGRWRFLDQRAGAESERRNRPDGTRPCRSSRTT